MGLIREGTGLAAYVLTTFNVSLDVVRSEVEKIIGLGTGEINIEMPFTSRAKRTLELALEGARELGHGYVGTEHLLLGLVREGEGVATRVLINIGINLQLLEQSREVRPEPEARQLTGSGSIWGTGSTTSTTTTRLEPGARQLAERLRDLLRTWVEPRALGQVGSNTRLFLGRDFLAVDLFWVTGETPEAIVPPQNVPELLGMIHVPSQSLESAQAVTLKIQFLLALGVRVGLLINPEEQTIAIHYSDGSIADLVNNQTLILPELLPGWELPLDQVWLPQY